MVLIRNTDFKYIEELFFRLALVTLSLDLMPQTQLVTWTILSCMSAFSTCSVSYFYRDYNYFTVTCVTVGLGVVAMNYYLLREEVMVRVSQVRKKITECRARIKYSVKKTSNNWWRVIYTLLLAKCDTKYIQTCQFSTSQ